MAEIGPILKRTHKAVCGVFSKTGKSRCSATHTATTQQSTRAQTTQRSTQRAHKGDGSTAKVKLRQGGDMGGNLHRWQPFGKHGLLSSLVLLSLFAHPPAFLDGQSNLTKHTTQLTPKHNTQLSSDGSYLLAPCNSNVNAINVEKGTIFHCFQPVSRGQVHLCLRLCLCERQEK